MRGGWGFELGFLHATNAIRHQFIEEKSELTVGLFSGEFFDVYSPFLSVDSDDLAFSALESSSHDLHNITLADGDGAHVVLGFQLLIQMAAHDLSSDA